MPDSTQPFRYSMLMWGQFDLLFDHAVKAKAIVKQVEAALASASALFDSLPTATNRGGGLLSSLSLSPHKPLSTATSSLAGTKAEAALLDALEHQLSQLDRAAQKTMKRIKKTVGHTATVRHFTVSSLTCDSGCGCTRVETRMQGIVRDDRKAQTEA